jgi:hypothetical protein
MIRIVCSQALEPLVIEHGARLLEGRWCVNRLSDTVRDVLLGNGCDIEGCRYKCWGLWFPNLYQITRDPRCTVSFNTLAKRACGLTELDTVVTGRARQKPVKQPKKTHKIEFQGQFYPSETALARELGLDIKKFRSRRQNHTLEEAVNYEKDR